MTTKWNALTYDEKKDALAIAYDYYHRNGFFQSPNQIFEVCALIREFRFRSVLDYGCGGGDKAHWENIKLLVPTLKTYYPYDPYSSDKDIRRHPRAGQRFDLVTCTDVLEHVLPEDIDEFLQDLLICSNKMLYVTICLSPAGKMVVDANGKTAYDQSLHTIVESKEWWLDRFRAAERAIREKQNRSIAIKIVWT